MHTRHTRILFALLLAILGSSHVFAQAVADRPNAQTRPLTGLADADFVPMMIKHHEDGIAMTRREEEKGASADVKALAAKIRQGQERDLPELKRHLAHVQAASKGSSDHKAYEQAMAQDSQATMKRLNSAAGAALDHAFLEEMVKHHEMAITMAQTAKLQNPDLKKLAQKMVAAQQQEIAALKKLLAAHK